MPIAHAEEPPPEVVVIETPQEMADRIADEFHVERKVMRHIISAESQWVVDAVGDMNITCKHGVNAGKPVRARGPVQITECYYPDVTDEQAFDWDFSLRFLAEKLAEGKETCRSQWSTCPM